MQRQCVTFTTDNQFHLTLYMSSTVKDMITMIKTIPTCLRLTLRFVLLPKPPPLRITSSSLSDSSVARLKGISSSSSSSSLASETGNQSFKNFIIIQTLSSKLVRDNFWRVGINKIIRIKHWLHGPAHFTIFSSHC